MSFLILKGLHFTRNRKAYCESREDFARNSGPERYRFDIEWMTVDKFLTKLNFYGNGVYKC